jgi:hypothetical protein
MVSRSPLVNLCVWSFLGLVPTIAHHQGTLRQPHLLLLFLLLFLLDLGAARHDGARAYARVCGCVHKSVRMSIVRVIAVIDPHVPLPYVL